MGRGETPQEAGQEEAPQEETPLREEATQEEEEESQLTLSTPLSFSFDDDSKSRTLVSSPVAPSSLTIRKLNPATASRYRGLFKSYLYSADERVAWHLSKI